MAARNHKRVTGRYGKAVSDNQRMLVGKHDSLCRNHTERTSRHRFPKWHISLARLRI